jgi:hypothetical protein
VTTAASVHQPRQPGRRGPRSIPAAEASAALILTGEMYGLQLDQLAEVLSATPRQARAVVGGWVGRGLADSRVLSAGPSWVWLTRAGLRDCGLHYPAAPPALSRLRHIRAVTAVRLALQAVPAYRDGAAHWRSERRLRSRLRIASRDHIPDAEVHWPDEPAAAQAPGQTPPDWAGECWAIEAELSPKTLTRTAAIMREILTRTGDYGCPVAEARVPGSPPRHARVLYLCSPEATGTVLRARDMLGHLGARIEVRALPATAALEAAP